VRAIRPDRIPEFDIQVNLLEVQIWRGFSQDSAGFCRVLRKSERNRGKEREK
jgi:hypothetical protein